MPHRPSSSVTIAAFSGPETVADDFAPVARELTARRVRFVLIGVAGANYFAPGGAAIFTTQDRDLFLPPDADNLMRAWDASEAAGLSLWSGDEPLDSQNAEALEQERGTSGLHHSENRDRCCRG